MEHASSPLKPAAPFTFSPPDADAVSQEVALGVRESLTSMTAPIVLAASQRKTEEANSLLMRSSDLNFVEDEGGNIAAHWAAFHGDVDMLSHILTREVGQQSQIAAHKNRAGLTPLHVAAYAGHAKVIELLHAIAKADLNLRDEAGRTPLHLAVASEALNSMQKLKELGADLEALDHSFCTPYALAYSEGRIRAVKALHELGAQKGQLLHYYAHGGFDSAARELLEASGAPSTDLPGSDGLTALIRASSRGHFSFVSLVLEKGAQIDKLCDGKAAVHVAAERGHLEVVKALVEKKKEVQNLKSGAGLTPLMVATQNNHLPIVKYLIESGADLETASPEQKRALHFAAEGNFLDIAKVLTEAKCQLDVFSKFAETPLMAAEIRGFKELAAHLLSAGAKEVVSKLSYFSFKGSLEELKALLFSTDVRSPTLSVDALHWAARGGQVEAIDMLLKAGLDPNFAIADTNETALLVASKSSAAVVEQLLPVTDLSIVNKLGRSCLHNAASSNQPEIVRAILLNKAGVDVSSLLHLKDKDGETALHLACTLSSPEVVGLLLEAGSDASGGDSTSLSPLHVACGCKESPACLEVVRLLIRYGAPINCSKTSANKYTPLLVFAINSNRSGVELLLTLGADIAAATSGLNNALHIAAYFGSYEIARSLLVAGIDVEALNSARQTALHWATMAPNLSSDKKVEMLNLLLDFGADINGRDANGDTAALLASINADLPVLRFLKEAGADFRVKNNRAQTLLHYLPLSSKPEPTIREVLHFLVKEAGLSLLDKSSDGLTTVQYCAAYNKHYLIEECVKDLGGMEALSMTDWELDSPFTQAANGGDVETLRLLLSLTTPEQQHHRTIHGYGAIHICSERGHLEALKLIKEQALNNFLTSSLRTSLHIAAAAGQAEIVRYLVHELGLQVNSSSFEPRPEPWQLKPEFSNAVSSERDKVLKFEKPHGQNVGLVLMHAPLPQSDKLVYIEIELSKLFSTEKLAKNNVFCAIGIKSGKDTKVSPMALPEGGDKSYLVDVLTGFSYSNKYGSQSSYSQKFFEKDIIGIVFNRQKGTLAFLRNGKHQGVAFKGIDVSLEWSLVVSTIEPITLTVLSGETVNRDDLLFDEERRTNPGSKEPFPFKAKTYPIHLAVYSRSLPTLSFLLEEGAVADQPDADGWTPLHFAALSDFTEGAELLLSRKADPNAFTFAGSPPLLLAVKARANSVARVLMDKGADCLFRDSKKRTLLMFAAQIGDTELMTLLIEKGVGIKEKDAFGRTAFQYASNSSTVTFLENQLNQITTYRGVFEINRSVPIRKGSGGLVVMAKHKATGNLCAIKYHNDEAARDSTFQILSHLHKDYVAGLAFLKGDPVKFDDAEKYPSCPFALVLDGGDIDLESILSDAGSTRLPENQIRFIFECLVACVMYLHSVGLVHGDLKPRNLVRFYDGRYRLVDFDSARKVGEPIGHPTLEFTAPEVAEDLLSNASPDSASRLTASQAQDVWALGCILFFMVFQTHLIWELLPDFKADFEEFRSPASKKVVLKALAAVTQEHIDEVLARLVNAKRGLRLIEHATSLMKHLLRRKPLERVDIKQAGDHSFIRGGSTDTMTGEALEGIRSELVAVHKKVEEIAIHVVSIEERTIILSELPAELARGFAEMGKGLQSLRRTVIDTKQHDCPSMFLLGPELTARESVTGGALTKPLGDWLGNIASVFSGELTIEEALKQIATKRLRLHLVCESCFEPVGEGYMIQQPAAWTVRMLPALKFSLKALTVMNAAASVGRLFFPAFPVVPGDVMDKAKSIVGALGSGGDVAQYSVLRGFAETVVKEQAEGGGSAEQAKTVNGQVGAGLRELRAFLKKADPVCSWGGLQLIHSGSKDVDGEGSAVLWVCARCLSSQCFEAEAEKASGTTVPREVHEQVKRKLEIEVAQLRARCKELEGLTGAVGNGHGGSTPQKKGQPSRLGTTQFLDIDDEAGAIGAVGCFGTPKKATPKRSAKVAPAQRSAGENL